MRRLLTALLAVVAASTFARLIVPGKFRALFLTAGQDQGVDPNMLHALQLTENPMENPDAVGAENANGTRDYGLMQINVLNFPKLGLGTISRGAGGKFVPDTDAWRDPAANVSAAAQLVASQKRAAPQLKTTDHFSVYNAGFSSDTTQGLRPKLDAQGGYLNGDYVHRAYAWFLLVTFAGVVPFKTIGWEA